MDQYIVSSGGASPFSTATSIPIGLSLFHTSFNIMNTFLLVWFVNFIANVVTKAIKTSGGDEYSLEYIGTGLMNTAELSIEEARKETVRLGEITSKMSLRFRDLLTAEKEKKQEKLLKKIRELEEMTDRMEVEISEYLIEVSTKGVLSPDSTVKVTILLSAINDLERMGDIFFQMSKDVDRINKAEKSLKEKQVNNLLRMLDLIDEAIAIMITNLNSNGNTSLDEAIRVENEIDALRNKLRKSQAKDIEKEKYDPKRDGYYKDLFHLCEKLGDHIINVSEAITGELERELKEETVE